MVNNSDKYKVIPVKEIGMGIESYKSMSLETFEKIKKSIEKYGQLQPLIVHETEGGYGIISGKYIHRAMMEIGIDKAICINLGNVPETTMQKIHLILNELKMDRQWILFAKYINKLKDILTPREIMYLMNCSEEEVKNILEVFEFNWEEKQIDPSVLTFQFD